MKFALLVVALAQAVSSGNVGVRSSSLLSPAGVTYVHGGYHAGLAAGPVAYSASVAQPVFQSAAPAVAVSPVASVAQVASVAPVAYAAAAPRYAAVPTVEHVPGVADVPVTRYEAQPAVVQKTVDVARAAVKTQRYELRRPAIQKQFYDIEERVVVRPAGSAVVELSEPLSKTQKGPSVIRPTGDAVAITSSGSVPVVDTVAPPAPPALPSVDINLARGSFPSAPAPPSVSSAPVDFSSVDVNLARSSFASAAPAPVPVSQINYARSSYAAAAPVAPAAPQINFARSSYAAAPAPPSVSPSPISEVNFARSSYAVSAPAAPPAPQISFAATPAPQINLARSSFAAAPAPQINYARSSFVAAPQINFARSSFAPAYPAPAVGFSAVPVKTVSVSAPVTVSAPVAVSSPVAVSAPVHTITGVSSISSGSSGISAVSGAPDVSFSTPTPQYPQQVVQTTPAPEYADDSVSIDSADFSLARSSATARQGYTGAALSRQGYQSPVPQAYPTPESVFRSEPRRFQSQASAAARSSLIVNYPNALDLVPQQRTSFRASPFYSQGSSQSEINHENQQKLIQLLTARGGVTEIGFGRSGSASYPVEAGQVSARVLSATPAPAYSAPTNERVNTRRVVVSRPIETLQEVEVAEPVTKYERVHVDEPTVIKTATQDVVRVPTSVPVYGKALAPIAEPVGWH